ncbi:MerR family transcriptional regulator [Streptomyces sp. RPA4-5]|uniref:MerR family transcriptional regulator n=1 Tax=Streptomyces TaxID=1883 RepID=UPI00143E64BA|nr:MULTISPECIES: MerR family transcriptional regulator [Streptomyces]MCX4634179.1 MerR family transcriptional regulator [Streptomyces platensis]QIY55354.1 MerR family transcriptional regulator [Streptomyces sp. RPA4-5]WJY38069.1 MerR family transcriptional regulator [Streptomyces sp. P9-2B-2]
MTVTQSEPAVSEATATGGLATAVRDCGIAHAHPRPTGRDQYTISEVAEHTGLSAHTLRWYERIGLMPHVDRTHTGQRRFSNRDLDWLDLVAKLRLTGMPVADMVRYAELVRAGERTFPEREQLLTAHREDVRQRVAELQSTLDVLDYKIEIYADARRASERF